ncbi:uncharacterized protein IL334_001721 [Kwoniella shivajii]|uniref:Uncharacterized protein n=1 Tax=Kwoniella shivajii TaxID=564305 RepID=A0ABZ1CTV5_9TREE|nr:hypothetical protein IL334_001721 [Kwoniella shivajii]
MSTINDTNTNLVCILSATALVYTIHHAHKFDRCRCLIPNKKDWFRALLTWMLLLCEIGMFIWGAGWAYVKYQLGWMYIPQKGTMPVPTILYTEDYKALNTPLTVWVCISFSLQVSLNAEEGLYWWHLMRAIRRPKSGKSWFRSPFFFIWLLISIITPIGIIGTGWIGYEGMDTQMGRMFVAGGVIEALVCLSASTVLLRFPKFLNNVKRSGAGPEVRSRLHFYHEANKVRTFFRAIFTTCILILGVDALTKERKINMNHIAADLLHQISFGSYFFANIVSVMVYLPRSYSSTPAGQQVMVGQQQQEQGLPVPSHQNSMEAGNAIDRRASQTLMSLLREGGQWDKDDDLRIALSKKGDDSPLRNEVNWDEETAINPSMDQKKLRRLTVLQNWRTPFSVPHNRPKLPSST